MRQNERALATIRRITGIQSIPERDRIIAYQIDGWFVIDQKDKYSVGEQVVYLEPDSWVPTELAPFLSKGKEPRVFENVKGERLKTIRMGGQLSQGLILPVSILDGIVESIYLDDLDVTVPLGILKYEKPIPAELAGLAKGNFPVEIPKTSATRIQNVRGVEFAEEVWSITEKLHGTSCTFYLDMQGGFHVCSRNLDLTESDTNTLWKIARENMIEEKMRDFCGNGIALQGEVIGQGINGNQYGLSNCEFFLFNVYSVKDNCYLKNSEILHFANTLHLNLVPNLDSEIEVSNNIQEMLLKADGQSQLNKSKREGFVMKNQNDTSQIIKVISNAWLLAGGDDK